MQSKETEFITDKAEFHTPAGNQILVKREPVDDPGEQRGNKRVKREREVIVLDV
jgi:hypothetical protein